MQELRRLIWCDVCHADSGALVEVTGRYAVSIQPGGTGTPLARLLEVCEIHAKPIEEMREILRLCGTPPPRPTNSRAAAEPEPASGPDHDGQLELPIPSRKVYPKQQCPLCPVRLSASGLVYHLQKAHGIERPPQPKKCPDCRYRSDSPMAMGAHRSREHNVSAIGVLMAQYKKGKVKT